MYLVGVTCCLLSLLYLGDRKLLLEEEERTATEAFMTRSSVHDVGRTGD